MSDRFVCAKKSDDLKKFFIREWHPSMVIADVSGLGTGTWAIMFYCSDPVTTEAYASNSKPLEIEKKKVNIQLFTGAFDAGKLAGALSEEYNEWIRDTNTNIDKLWVEEGSPGAVVNCIFKRKPHTVILEIYHQDFRIAHSEQTQFDDTEEGRAFSQHFSDLGPGYYVLKCFQKDQRNIVKYAHSFMFQLQ